MLAISLLADFFVKLDVFNFREVFPGLQDEVFGSQSKFEHRCLTVGILKVDILLEQFLA